MCAKCFHWLRHFCVIVFTAFIFMAALDSHAKFTLTNSPLHALTTLNDVTFVEAARVLATRILDETPDASNQQLVERAFRRVLIRPPEPSELDILTKSFSRLEKRYSTQGDLATQLIHVGEFREPNSHAVPRLAAMTGLCNLLLNLDETLCRE